MVSVIVIGRNEALRLQGCIRAISYALAEIPHEILYVDSRSTDASLMVAHAAGARCFCLRASDTTAGLARRVGTKEAAGDLLLFLDGDMHLCPGFVDAAHALLHSAGHPKEVVGVTGIRTDIYEQYGRPVREVSNYYRCKRQREAPEFGGALLIKAEALAKAGGWAANVIACEEAELHARLQKHRVSIIELPIPMIRHYDNVRYTRSRLDTLLTPRRLGLGQALRHGIHMRSFPRLLWRERLAFGCWMLDALCIVSVLLGGPPALWGVLAVQAFECAVYVRKGCPRGYVGQKLLLGYIPAGFFSYFRRDEGYDPWPAEQAYGPEA